jgi:polyisoprenoid-binding protein YceI
MWRWVVLPLAVAAVPYQIGPAPGSRLSLEVYKSGLWNGRKHSFTFERYQGSLLYDAGAPEHSQVRFTVDAASIALRDAWVNEKDRDKIVKFALTQMLHADRYPELEFSSTRITPAGLGHFEVQGTLGMAGISKPVSVQVTLGADLSIEGSARLKMTDWGMKPPSAALGTIGTRDEMSVAFVLKPAARSLSYSTGSSWFLNTSPAICGGPKMAGFRPHCTPAAIIER